MFLCRVYRLQECEPTDSEGGPSHPDNGPWFRPSCTLKSTKYAYFGFVSFLQVQCTELPYELALLIVPLRILILRDPTAKTSCPDPPIPCLGRQEHTVQTYFTHLRLPSALRSLPSTSGRSDRLMCCIPRVIRKRLQTQASRATRQFVVSSKCTVPALRSQMLLLWVLSALPVLQDNCSSVHWI